MKDNLTVDEINAKLQDATNEDAKDVFEDPGLYDYKTGIGEDTEGWDEFVKRVLAKDPPEDLEEEV